MLGLNKGPRKMGHTWAYPKSAGWSSYPTHWICRVRVSWWRATHEWAGIAPWRRHQMRRCPTFADCCKTSSGSHGMLMLITTDFLQKRAALPRRNHGRWYKFSIAWQVSFSSRALPFAFEKWYWYGMRWGWNREIWYIPINPLRMSGSVPPMKYNTVNAEPLKWSQASSYTLSAAVCCNCTNDTVELVAKKGRKATSTTDPQKIGAYRHTPYPFHDPHGDNDCRPSDSGAQ